MRDSLQRMVILLAAGMTVKCLRMTFLNILKPSFISLVLFSLFFLESCTKRQDSLTPQVVLAPHQVMVTQGETVYSLAYKHGISTRSLIEANRLQAPYTLLPGQVLIIPEPEMPKTLPLERPLEESKTGGPIAIHKSLEPLPPLSGGATSSGAPLVVAPGGGPIALGVKKENVLPPDPLPKKASPLDPAIARELDLEQESLAQRKQNEQNPQPVSKPSSPEGNQKFPWPVQGKVIGNYGRGAGGGDGIRIAAPEGTPIHAILEGKVIYAGNEIKNLENLVLIEHEGGWISAYGCTKELLVKNGDRVKKGQSIAQVGGTGNVEQPQLYFEIRKNKKTVDPLTYLGS